MSAHEQSSAEPPHGQNETILEVRDLSVRYEMSRGISQVLDGVSLDIHRDEILGVVGESGSGKSMCASALLDAVPKPGGTFGEITYYPEGDRDPVNVLDLSEDELQQYRWEEIALVFQGAMASFNPTMKIYGHFKETIEAHDMDPVVQMEHAYNLLEDLYLDPERVMDSYPHELSGGMTQRALIALSLVLEPDILVMDEPTAALDLLMQRSITSMLADLQKEYNLTIIFITHDLPLVAGLVDRIAVMYAFEFVELGTADDILLEAAHPYTRALLRAVPSLTTPVEGMSPIEGDSPDPVNVPAGCSYHPRCPLATDVCRSQDPSYFEVDGDHEAACFHWEQAADAIEYTLVPDSEEDPI